MQQLLAEVQVPDMCARIDGRQYVCVDQTHINEPPRRAWPLAVCSSFQTVILPHLVDGIHMALVAQYHLRFVHWRSAIVVRDCDEVVDPMVCAEYEDGSGTEPS